ncbi:MAG: trehalose-6-phosphate synthase [Actinobacteria bacterium]|nr:trehalose-6-phosphate synthase [Actinomycetota bacterium]
MSEGDPARPVVVVAHRGPVSFVDVDGDREMRRGAGGLVTALRGLRGYLEDGVWVCAALSDADRAAVADSGDKPFEVDGGYRVRMVALDPDEHHRFYAIIANPILWFIQHYLWDLSNAPDITGNEIEAFEHGYVPINRAIGEAAAEEVERAGGRALVMIHDYHFYLVGPEIRRRCPDALVHHFIHIPWPQPDAWRVLPGWMRRRLIEGLLACDIVAFHTERFARNFVLTCRELLDLRVDMDSLTVDVGDRTVAARWYPISIDAADLEEQASGQEVDLEERRIENGRREFLILRVDRTDLSKNILRGFKAFDQLLDDHPELSGRVSFLALLQPSRQDVDEYVEYVERIRRLVADINLKHGNPEWQPISLQMGDALPRAMAAYRQYDVLVVNSVFDGMNLVAKEGVLLNRRNGVLVLSEHTGVHEELGAFALTVHPFDIQALADAMYAAIAMPQDERRTRLNACAAVVRGNDLAKWLRVQLDDLAVVEAGRAELNRSEVRSP